MSISTDLDKVRVLIGDTDSTAPLFPDDQINWVLSEQSNLYLAAADLCEIASRKFARAFDFETDGQKFARSQMFKFYSDSAKTLRARVTGITTHPVTKIDGDNVYEYPADEIAGGTANPRQRFWTVDGVDRLP